MSANWRVKSTVSSAVRSRWASAAIRSTSAAVSVADMTVDAITLIRVRAPQQSRLRVVAPAHVRCRLRAQAPNATAEAKTRVPGRVANDVSWRGMDNVCHTLVGAALGEAGLKQRTRYGNVTLMIAANLPDID